MLLTLLTAGFLLAPLVNCSGDGNFHLLEDEIANALKICADSVTSHGLPERSKREESGRKIDSNGNNPSAMDGEYEHPRRNTTVETQVNLHNDTGTADGLAVAASGGEHVNAAPEQNSRQRVKRLDPLAVKTGVADECLSQCVFAQMQVVDARGIPREPELWGRVQGSVTSQQSRAALRDQLRACFQELESEAEDDGCSYSNKLERCLTLRLADRQKTTSTTDKKS